MRVTIVPVDGLVNIDGLRYLGLDLSFIPNNVHAVQWYDTYGEVEIKDPVTGKMISNDDINSLDSYQPAIDAWNSAKLAEEAAAVKKAEEDRMAAEQAAAAEAEKLRLAMEQAEIEKNKPQGNI